MQINDLPVIENDHVGSDSTQNPCEGIEVLMPPIRVVSAEDAQRPLQQLPTLARLPQPQPGSPQVDEGSSSLHGLWPVSELGQREQPFPRRPLRGGLMPLEAVFRPPASATEPFPVTAPLAR